MDLIDCNHPDNCTNLQEEIYQEWTILLGRLVKMKLKFMRCREQLRNINKFIATQKDLLKSISIDRCIDPERLDDPRHIVTEKICNSLVVQNALRNLIDKKATETYQLEVLLYETTDFELSDDFSSEFMAYMNRRLIGYKPINLNDSDYIQILANALRIKINEDGSISNQNSRSGYSTDQISPVVDNEDNSGQSDDNFDFNHLESELNELMNEMN